MYGQNLAFSPKNPLSGALWYIPVIPAFRRQRQENQEFKVILSNIVSLKASLETMLPGPLHKRRKSFTPEFEMQGLDRC